VFLVQGGDIKVMVPILLLALVEQVHGVVVDANVGLKGVGGTARW
jgi:hypothetical protein